SATVDEIAERYGDAVARAVMAIDPLFLLPKKMPKLPAFANVSALPKIELRAGGVLPDEAVENVLTMLALTEATTSYAGLAQVRDACTATSLRDFAWALFERWLTAGGPSKEGWALRALGELGDDDVASRLAPKIRAWPTEKALARASVGLEVLARIGTDIALMHVDRLAQGFRFASVRERAQELIQQIATERGLSAEELEDRLSPTLGLEADGTRSFDFGDRSFRVGFDEHLLPSVRDSNGRVLADLPKPTKGENSELAKAAHDEWKKLKNNAKAVAARQIARFERAMCNERTWRMADFDLFIRRHPLIGHLARRLVWRLETSTGERMLVRVAEDGTLANADDVSVVGPEDARIGVVHALHLEASEIERWSKVFADYEIVQPFEQLSRRTYPLSDETGAGAVLEPGYIRGLRERGWSGDGESTVTLLVKSVEHEGREGSSSRASSPATRSRTA
ncbi:MAG: Molybdate metabolism regulator, partial [Labilithrix sp.]|nr:Molybdate metabolism regulator [Labilithrix sp.]